MRRKVKLVNEWAEWLLDRNATEVRWALMGTDDFVASIISKDGLFVGNVYTLCKIVDGITYYRMGHRVGPYATVEEGRAHCEQKLLEAGMIDLMWWVSQCEE